jgi:hypothetical protein
MKQMAERMRVHTEKLAGQPEPFHRHRVILFVELPQGLVVDGGGDDNRGAHNRWGPFLCADEDVEAVLSGGRLGACLSLDHVPFELHLIQAHADEPAA